MAATPADLMRRMCHVRTSDATGPPETTCISARNKAEQGEPILTFQRFGLHQREGVQREQLERLGKYELR